MFASTRVQNLQSRQQKQQRWDFTAIKIHGWEIPFPPKVLQSLSQCSNDQSISSEGFKCIYVYVYIYIFVYVYVYVNVIPIPMLLGFWSLCPATGHAGNMFVAPAASSSTRPTWSAPTTSEWAPATSTGEAAEAKWSQSWNRCK